MTDRKKSRPDVSPPLATVLRDPVHFLAFGCGSGLLPRAPGTWASAFTALAYYALSPIALPVLLTSIVLLFVAGVWICGESARRLGIHDHGGIVLDEVVGMLLTLVVAGHEPVWVLVAFAGFRVADIAKPWPIRDVDHRLHGGLGIMLDDVLAAVYAAIFVLLLQRFTPFP